MARYAKDAKTKNVLGHFIILFRFFILRERAKYSELKISLSNPFEH